MPKTVEERLKELEESLAQSDAIMGDLRKRIEDLEHERALLEASQELGY